MHPVHVRVHHWFVPHRLVWDSWEDFITGGPDGDDSSAFPTITLTGGAAVGSLADYLGCPTGVQRDVSALPFRGYALIWNEWYRDQDLQNPLVISKADGADATTNTALQNVDWEKDYFTSARPWTQKGPDIVVPLGTAAPLVSANYAADSVNYKPLAGAPSGSGPYTWGTSGIGAMYADLSSATAASINDLREAFALQRYEENRARYGSRFTEYLAFLGVRSSDARLQRPEYLGGGKQVIQFSEVLQTPPP